MQRMFKTTNLTDRTNQLKDYLIKYADEVISEQQSNKQVKRQQFMLYYSLVYQLCNSKPSLQQKMLTQFKHSLSYIIQSFIQQYKKRSPFRFRLQNSCKTICWFDQLWKKYNVFYLNLSKKVFSYLDRYYLPGMEENSLQRVALQVFRENVCHQGNMKFFTECFLKQLRQIREQKLIQNYNLHIFCQAILSISPQLYIEPINSYLQQSITYYQSFYRLNHNLTSIQYYNKSMNLFRFEEVLSNMTIVGEVKEVEGKFQEIVIKQYTGIFIKSEEHGMSRMFRTKNVEFMKIVNQVYTKFEGFHRIKQAYYAFILEQGQRLIEVYKTTSSSVKNNTQLISSVYQFYKSHLNLITLGFNKRNQLFITLNNAIQKIISRIQKFTSLFYQYCSEVRSSNLFDLNREKITLLFQKAQAKDQFIVLYENQMYKKISQNSIDLNKQEQFVLYLNQICGNQLTHKLIKKIKDAAQQRQVSNELMKMSHPGNIVFKISILSLQLWEKKFNDQISLNINMPSELQAVWRSVQRNYSEKDPKKKLIVLPFDNKLTLQIRFNRVRHLMKCNLIQACIFMFLSQRPYASQQELILNLMVEKNLLQNTIQTLQLIPNLLIKTTLGDYLINWQFKPQNLSQIIDLASQVQQSKQMTKAIRQDRQILVQAAIVKFIKKNKQATFEEIVLGITKSIRLFKPQPVVVKAAVEKLIKKGFIQQKEGGLLQYVE